MIVYVMEINFKSTERRIVRILVREIIMEILARISAKNVLPNAPYVTVLHGLSVLLVTLRGF